MSEPDTLIEVYRARIEAARELLDRAEAHLDLGSRCVNTLAKQVQLSGALKAIQRVSSIVAVASNDAADATSLKALSGDHPVAWPKSRSALAAGSSAKAG